MLPEDNKFYWDINWTPAAGNKFCLLCNLQILLMWNHKILKTLLSEPSENRFSMFWKNEHVQKEDAKQVCQSGWGLDECFNGMCHLLSFLCFLSCSTLNVEDVLLFILFHQHSWSQKKCSSIFTSVPIPHWIIAETKSMNASSGLLLLWKAVRTS